MESARLDELDQDEMWDVCRILCPRMEREEFQAHWEEFCARKARGEFEIAGTC